MKSAADAALHFHVANMAANHFEGVTIPPANRDYPEYHVEHVHVRAKVLPRRPLHTLVLLGRRAELVPG